MTSYTSKITKEKNYQQHQQNDIGKKLQATLEKLQGIKSQGNKFFFAALAKK